VLTLEGQPADGAPLLEPAMRGGKRIATRLPLAAVRERTAASLAQLPEPLRQLETAPAFVVQVAACVRRLAEEVDAYEVAQSRGQ
jgi:nicotinate phosphoribosyltransferase